LNIDNITQRQFDFSMRREKITIIDYYDPSIQYDVFFRRDNCGTSPQGNGDFKYASATMDYNTIKLYLDNLKQMLNDIACIPSVLGSSTNIANISEISMEILMMMANLNADETKKWLNIGFAKRFEKFQKILAMQGIEVTTDVSVIYNVSAPIASSDMIANLKALKELGAISTESIMEKSDVISDVDAEKERLRIEKSTGESAENKGK